MGEELEKLRAQLDQARKQTNAANDAQRDAAELVELKQELADEEHITQAIKDHGAIGVGVEVLRTRTGAVVLRSPKQASWRQFSDADSLKGPQLYTLVKSCLVYPDALTFEKILEAHPAALEQTGLLVTRLAGVVADNTAGK